MKKKKTPRSGGNGEVLPNAGKKPQRRKGTPSEPIVLCEILRNAREDIRVCLSRYQGGMTLDIRTWHHGEHGIIPTKNGIAFGVQHLPAFERAIAEAVRIAESEGYLTTKEAGR